MWRFAFGISVFVNLILLFLYLTERDISKLWREQAEYWVKSNSENFNRWVNLLSENFYLMTRLQETEQEYDA